MKSFLLACIRFYKKGISPYLGNNCRFYPSCSEYTYQAIEKYGAFVGAMKGIKRIVKCHPLHPGGFDPLD